MRTDVPFLPPDSSVDEAWQWALQHDAPAYLVGTRDHLRGAITHQQLDEWKFTEKAHEPIATVVTDSFVHAHADHPIDVVLERLAESGGVLPVVSRAEVHRVEEGSRDARERPAHARQITEGK